MVLTLIGIEQVPSRRNFLISLEMIILYSIGCRFSCRTAVLRFLRDIVMLVGILDRLVGDVVTRGATVKHQSLVKEYRCFVYICNVHK